MRATRLPARGTTLAWLRTGLVALLSAAAAVTLNSTPVGVAGNTITQPDSGGQYTSFKLDSSGFPVISHYDPTAQDLKIVHCGNSVCSAGNIVTAPDPTTIAAVGHTSLALAGNTPVVTHYDSGPRDLKLVRCGNAACSSGNAVRTLDSGQTDNVGIYASVAINGSGNPVVAYYTEPFDILKVLVCADATCSTYGDQNVDATPITGLYTSLALDASGFPVISYYDQSAADLNVVHCLEATCSNKVITPVDGSVADVGKYTSLALDSAGFPVVSYYNETNGDLKVVHCGDANCTSGNTIATPDAGGGSNVGQYTSLALDAAGNPVVSYYNMTQGDLKVLHCGNAMCTAGNAITTPDSAGTVGQYTSLALDAGVPVVSYYDATDGKLNVLHCGDAACSGTSVAVGGLTGLTSVVAPANVRAGGAKHSGTLAAVVGGALILLATAFLVARRSTNAHRGNG